MGLIKKRKDKDFEVRERLSDHIHKGVKYLSKSAIEFNKIVKDKEQKSYSIVKAAALVVALDSIIKLAGNEDANILSYAAAVLMAITSDDDISKKLENNYNIEEKLLKEGKNVVVNVPKTVH
jgi:L-lactate utilization protein LutC